MTKSVIPLIELLLSHVSCASGEMCDGTMKGHLEGGGGDHPIFVKPHTTLRSRASTLGSDSSPRLRAPSTFL